MLARCEVLVGVLERDTATRRITTGRLQANPDAQEGECPEREQLGEGDGVERVFESVSNGVERAVLHHWRSTARAVFTTAVVAVAASQSQA